MSQNEYGLLGLWKSNVLTASDVLQKKKLEWQEAYLKSPPHLTGLLCPTAIMLPTQ
jgi:hypothetical protein